MAQTSQELIAYYEGAFEVHGYFVGGEAIPGEEPLWAQSLREAFEKMLETLSFVQTRYGCRGRSQRALKILHESLPSPGFGIEVKSW